MMRLLSILMRRRAALALILGRFALTLVLFLGVVTSGCGQGGKAADGHDEHAGEAAGAHDEHGEGEEEAARGPHGGRLFHEGETAFELAVNDEGRAPTMQGWIYDGAMKLVRPGAERLEVDLNRFNGSVDRITFRVDGDHFHSEQPIAEPHSYAAEVRLTTDGKTRTWSFEQEEGRIEIAPQAVGNAGIEIAPAAEARLSVLEESPGEVKLNRERVLLVTPRYAGTLRQLRKRLGDTVRAGETVAIIQSNESLADYEVVSRIAGTVIGQGATAGQTVHPEEEILTVADLSEVWVDFPIYTRNQGRVRPGLPALVTATSSGGAEATGTVRYVGPMLEQETRVSMGRIVLPNKDRRWQPGMYVDVKVAVEDVRVPVTVPEEAIVRMGTSEAVFRARSGGIFESQPVVTGRTDGRRTEILEGLAAGDTIVVRNAFLLKAELGKSEAKHDH